MSKSPPIKGSATDMKAGRERLIRGITTGFAFFALVVLVTETILSWTAVQIGPGQDRTIVVCSGVGLLTLLTLLVALLLYFKPWVLTGDPPPPIIVKQLAPPVSDQLSTAIQYFLRGIRESYLHVLQDTGVGPPPAHLRINVMLVLPSTVKKAKVALKIKHVDYPNLFATDEFLQEYPQGVGNCGEAWRLSEQRTWAVDLSDTTPVDMDDVTSLKAKDRRSVLSSPILCRGECIGVLNLDSDEKSESTHVELTMVQNLLREASREIVPLLYSSRNDGG